jgi:predicted PurR-regulated permease PerM
MRATGALLSCFLWALFLAYALRAPLSLLESLLVRPRDTPFQRRAKRGVCVAFLVLAAAGLAALFLVQSLPAALAAARKILRDLPAALLRLQAFLESKGELRAYLAADWLFSGLRSLSGAVLSRADFVGILGGAASFAGAAPFTLFLSVWLLCRKETAAFHASRLFKRIFGERRAAAPLRFLRETDAIVKNFFLGKLLQALILFLLCLLVFLPFKIPSAFLLSMLCAVGNFFPYVGAPLSGAVCLLVTLLYAPEKVFALFLFLIGLQLLDNFLIGPKTLSGATGINPALALAAMTVGGALGGTLGVLAAVPAAAALKLLYAKWI